MPAFLQGLQEGGLDQGEDFWRFVATDLAVTPSASWMQELVQEAKLAGRFKTLPANRTKTTELWLMELCKDPARRSEAVQALG